MIEHLIEDSKRGNSLQESPTLSSMQFNADTIKTAEKYIKDHPDYTAYHLLLGLRKKEPDAYDRIPDDTRASILCSALEHLNYLNDWGYLEPSESYDGIAAKALIETGKAAVDCLVPLLDNKKPAELFGSEEATLSHMYHYRRNDFAYRSLARILGVEPRFEKDPGERDKEIAKLKEKAEGKSKDKKA